MDMLLLHLRLAIFKTGFPVLSAGFKKIQKRGWGGGGWNETLARYIDTAVEPPVSDHPKWEN